MNRPDFLDQPDCWTRSPRDSRDLAQRGNPFNGPYTRPESLGHRVVRYLVTLIGVVMVGLIVTGRL